MESADQTWPEVLARWIAESNQSNLPPALAEALSIAQPAEIEQLLEQLAEVAGEEADEKRPWRYVLQLIAARILRLRLEADQASEPIVDPILVADLASELADISLQATAHCLQILSAQGDSQSLEILASLLKQPLVSSDHAIAVALSPLFQWPPAHLAELFTMMGEEIWNASLLPPLLDLAGHALRKRKLRQHPLQLQAGRLRELLSGTVGRLSLLEEKPQQFGSDVRTIQDVLNNAIALTVSLCDALGLVGDQEAEAQLNKALSLSHRRVQTEAAGALARLGKAGGKERLLQLAQDPAARLRALAYLDELGIDQPELAQWREPVALAEAEATAWLADRERFGVPPAELELIDERMLYWPSYEDPQSCFLFRFTYHFSQGTLSNLIMAGPLVYAFQTDLRSLETDDAYAVFAGWQAEHADIYEVPANQFNTAQRSEALRLLDAPEHEGIDDLKPLALTFFLGERAVLATGSRDGQPVCTISDGLETLTMPCDNRPTSFSPDLVLALYRGRKLLRSFNP